MKSVERPENKPDVLNDRVLVVINKWKNERVVGRTENYI
jgi:hypothetical protein